MHFLFSNNQQALLHKARHYSMIYYINIVGESSLLSAPLAALFYYHLIYPAIQEYHNSFVLI